MGPGCQAELADLCMELSGFSMEWLRMEQSIWLREMGFCAISLGYNGKKHFYWWSGALQICFCHCPTEELWFLRTSVPQMTELIEYPVQTRTRSHACWTVFLRGHHRNDGGWDPGIPTSASTRLPRHLSLLLVYISAWDLVWRRYLVAKNKSSLTRWSLRCPSNCIILR